MDSAREELSLFDVLLFTPNFEKIIDNESFFGKEKEVLRAVFCGEHKKLFYNNPALNENPLYTAINFFQRIVWQLIRKCNQNLDNLKLFKMLAIKLVESKQKFYEGLSNTDFFALNCKILIELFLKENWTGPSFTHTNTEKWYKKERVQKAEEDYPEKLLKKRTILFEALEVSFEDLLDSLQITRQDLQSFDYKDFKNKQFILDRHPETFANHFMIDGEDCYKNLRYMNLYLGTREMLDTVVTELGMQTFSCRLMRGRMAYLHSQLMLHPTNSLYITLTKYYDFSIQTAEKFQEKFGVQNLACLYIEYANSILHYFKYESCLEHLTKAKTLLNVEFNFTGKLGVRTKYQKFKCAQMILEVTKTIEEPEKSAQDIQQELENEVPSNVCLDDIPDNILLETPKLDDISQVTELNVYDHLLILGMIRHLEKTTPIDDAQREFVVAYLNKNLEKFSNWSITTKNLLIRSLYEFKSIKKRERSIIQIEQLGKDWNAGDMALGERLRYFWSLDYPSHIELQMILAEKYNSVGMLMSSSTIYENLNMVEETVECFFYSGHRDRAAALAEQALKENPTPKLFCTLGDIHKDPEYYQKAWELSNHKYARAMRGLGNFYYNKQEIDKAVEFYEKAVEVNEFHFKTWMILGFIYMTKTKFEKAIFCFQKVLQVDGTQSTAWANLSGIYLKMKEYVKSFNAIEQALKLDEGNFRMWINFMETAYLNKKFGAYLRALHKLLVLQKKDFVEEFMVKRLNIIMNIEIESLTKEPISLIRSTELTCNKIEGLYKELIKHLPMSPFIYHYYCDFVEFKFQIYSVKKAIRDKEKIRNADFEGDLEIVAEGQEDENQDGGEDQEDTQLNPQDMQEPILDAGLIAEDMSMEFNLEHGVQEKVMKIKKSAKTVIKKPEKVYLFSEPTISTEEYRKQCLRERFDISIKECNIVMKAGWEIEIADCEAVFDATLRMVQFFREVNDQDMRYKLEIHIKAISSILAKTLEGRRDMQELKLD